MNNVAQQLLGGIQQQIATPYNTLMGVRDFNNKTFGVPGYANPKLSPQAQAMDIANHVSPFLTMDLVPGAGASFSPEQWQQIQHGAEMGIHNPQVDAAIAGDQQAAAVGGKTIGQIQAENQGASGKPLLAAFDKAASGGDKSKLQSVITDLLHQATQPNSPYAPYLQSLYTTMQNIKAFK